MSNEMLAIASQIKGLRRTLKDLNDKLTTLENQLKEAIGPEDIDVMIGGMRILPFSPHLPWFYHGSPQFTEKFHSAANADGRLTFTFNNSSAFEG